MIKKVIIPVAGLGTRFLPQSKVLPKEFFPLVDKPVIQYIIEEVMSSGVKQIVFVINPEKNLVSDYFKKNLKLKKLLKNKNKAHLLDELEELEKIAKSISFSYVSQKKPIGNGHAILQAKNKIGKNEPYGILFNDDIIISKIPCFLQLSKVFETYQRPIIALKKVPKEEVYHYGIVKVEKIANRFYKIKDVVEKPAVDSAPSDLAIVGRYILTPEIFDILEKIPHGKNKELLLTDAFEKMLKDQKTIYGYEIEGDWLECGDKERWLKSNLLLSLRHPEFGPKLRKYLKKIKF
ncbi:UTP--glucose-1-phosphate uridylyltransferase [Candidatus Parcubacteria bacterium]|nr:UTP--glucose-1-phosphate uridylyltransferase [Candidatus Parcubacteria bacterium]